MKGSLGTFIVPIKIAFLGYRGYIEGAILFFGHDRNIQKIRFEPNWQLKGRVGKDGLAIIKRDAVCVFRAKLFDFGDYMTLEAVPYY